VRASINGNSNTVIQSESIYSHLLVYCIMIKISFVKGIIICFVIFIFEFNNNTKSLWLHFGVIIIVYCWNVRLDHNY